MTLDETAGPTAAFTAQPGTTADGLLRIARLTKAESLDVGLFIAPSRLRLVRRMRMTGLLWSAPLPDPAPDNDN